MIRAFIRELPDDLPRRVHGIRPDGDDGDGSFVDTQGEFVLYWMRSSVRGHENPALDVGLHLARELNRPLFIYQALSERYPYASDRHHRFILEGARDVQSELAERGIGYAFHMERPGHRGPHLVTLAKRAAAIVTEDFPTRPLDRWTQAAADRAGRGFMAVDSACLVPMRTVEASMTTRAYAFRRATESRRRGRLTTPPREVEVMHDARIPELPFEPVDLETADIEALMAACEIDHGIGPVSHTPGGSRQGYARWTRFRDDALKGYAQRRNDPLQPGVSRMSPYLHYGHVAPFRIAREAWEVGGKDAEKYLDELLVWREVAWAFCAAHPEHETLDGGVPGWAAETLRAHEDDPRVVLSWETLARGVTGDPFWDLAQRSLVRHGELHNNARMTWGKALLGWSPDAETALSRMIDLNHRYALDGRDPSSYGGILWCLGQFDRPFQPERKVFGTVRSRTTHQQAARMDLDQWAARIELPPWQAPRVAVIGAGLSGLMAARTLHDHGMNVTVFDKGRRPGGRMNTREQGDHSFDHGAQYFTIRDRRLEPFLRSWREDGVVAQWTGRIMRLSHHDPEPARKSARWVATPGMISLPLHLSAHLQVQTGHRVTTVERTDDGRLRLLAERLDPHRPADAPPAESVEVGTFDRVIVAVPAPQAVPLLAAAPELAEHAAEVEMAPCWAVMATFGHRTGADMEAAFVSGGNEILSWVARDDAKPGRDRAPGGGESWVLHAGPEWSQDRLNEDPETVASSLIRAFADRLGLELPTPVFRRAHLWRYARAASSVEGDSLHAPEVGLVACGDWCAGGRVEGALLSGISAAGRILREAPVAPGNPLGYDPGVGGAG